MGVQLTNASTWWSEPCAREMLTTDAALCAASSHVTEDATWEIRESKPLLMTLSINPALTTLLEAKVRFCTIAKTAARTLSCLVCCPCASRNVNRFSKAGRSPKLTVASLCLAVPLVMFHTSVKAGRHTYSDSCSSNSMIRGHMPADTTASIGLQLRPPSGESGQCVTYASAFRASSSTSTLTLLNCSASAFKDVLISACCCS
mmetsp:Transcript_77231/g.140397  ORF Transcript_77231/g.140397 Transcript_77231/m.140397 type:complete len:203 (-) Transcript_77231:184-792(-)